MWRVIHSSGKMELGLAQVQNCMRTKEEASRLPVIVSGLDSDDLSQRSDVFARFFRHHLPKVESKPVPSSLTEGHGVGVSLAKRDPRW